MLEVAELSGRLGPKPLWDTDSVTCIYNYGAALAAAQKLHSHIWSHGPPLHGILLHLQQR